MAHLSAAQQIAAGLRALPDGGQAFAATQGAWRFFSNPHVALPQLAAPLIEAARLGVAQTCQNYVLIALDWCLLHYCGHASKHDRIMLMNENDLGYKLLTALALSDGEGRPLAPVCLELEAGSGIHSTRGDKPLKAKSALDGLEPVMAHVEGLQLGRPAVYVIDREGDSIAHLRSWDARGRKFLVRAKDAPRAWHGGCEQRLGDVAGQVPLAKSRDVEFEGAAAVQFVGETSVELKRSARTHRVVGGKAKHKNVAGAPLTVRLIVSEVRDADGRVLARWLLLSNLPAEVRAATLALWYYWRWRIESYHKLLKSAGQHVESWLQKDAHALAARLAVAAMAGVVVWQLARDERPEAETLRHVLVRLSGRLMKRGEGRRSFTEPALLAGLGVLLSMLNLLEETSLDELKSLVHQLLPDFLPNGTDESG
ncbi:MAG TPA: IS4 family transposase [Planctomycetota bacterium]|nr:IS4 family transposase [Planctomycetota bacterium]